MIFSQIDLNQGFYQIPVAKSDQHLTSFVILNQQFEFTRMPFGLSNAPRTFQSAMLDMLGNLDFVKIYLDDILIHSPSVEAHKEHLRTVFTKLENENVSVNWEKTRLLQDQVKYLGHLISAAGIKPDISRTEAMKINVPQTKREIMRTLGLLQRFRPYLKDAAELLRFLTERLKKDCKEKWTTKDTEKLKLVIEKIKEQTLLNFSSWNEPMSLETYASEFAIGAVLRQKKQAFGVLFSCSFR